MRGYQDYLESKVIKDRIINNGDNKITFIYGDGGVSYRLPRADCKIIGNTYHLLNGIGDFNNDLIIVLVNKKLYLMKL